MKVIRKTYYGGVLKHPVTITQRLWDEITERRKEYEEFNKDSKGYFLIDTTYGSDDIGERPIIPDWIYTAGKTIFCLISFACLLFIIYIFKRGY